MDLASQVAALKLAHPGLVLKWRQTSASRLYLDLIYLPVRQRRVGVGTHVLTVLTTWADTHGVELSLSAEPLFETPRQVLIDFYMRFGFQLTGRKMMTRVCANTQKVC